MLVVIEHDSKLDNTYSIILDNVTKMGIFWTIADTEDGRLLKYSKLRVICISFKNNFISSCKRISKYFFFQFMQKPLLIHLNIVLHHWPNNTGR